MQDLLARGALEGEGQGVFVAVYAEEVGAFAGAGAGEGAVGCVFGVGWAPGAGVVAAGWVFDFDDFCAGENICVSTGVYVPSGSSRRALDLRSNGVVSAVAAGPLVLQAGPALSECGQVEKSTYSP